MKKYYLWLSEEKHLNLCKVDNWQPQEHIGYMWEYLWARIDMNDLAQNWNFNYIDIYEMLYRKIESLA